MRGIDAAILSLAVGLTAFTLYLFAADYPKDFVSVAPSSVQRPVARAYRAKITRPQTKPATPRRSACAR
jgi:hypothetical protein